MLRPGMVPLVSVSPATVSLWLLDLEEGDSSGGDPPVDLVQEARQAWLQAVDALPRHLPVLWDRLDRFRDAGLQSVRIRKIERRTDRESDLADPVAGVLDGPSFGLSFALAVASSAMGFPIREDLAATARLDPLGNVHRVGEVARKIRGLLEMAPGIAQVLVAQDNAEEATDAAGGRIRILPVRHLQEALSVAFGDRLETFVAGCGSDPRQRRRITEALFRLALGNRRALSVLIPVMQTADQALDQWPNLRGSERWKMEFARATAARHEGREDVPLPLPRNVWLRSLPEPVCIDLAAHLVQQAADTGTPAPGTVRRLIQRFLVRGRGAHPAHLRLLGAWARWEAVAGSPRRSMDLAREAAQGWHDRHLYEEVSHPLCLWYRLAAALGDRTEFRRVERFREELERASATDLLEANEYVRLAVAAARVELGNTDDRTLDMLASMDPSMGGPPHVGWCAVRWLVLALRKRGEGEEAGRVIDRMDAARDSPEDRDRSVTCNRILLDLRLAVESGDPERQRTFLDNLRRETPALVDLLARSARRECDSVGRYVSRFYPY
ncbi:hypothetical protein KBD49_09655 [Myxococcota bacterium]|nr:hypothetical protein [Myxococcota bacterium]